MCHATRCSLVALAAALALGGAPASGLAQSGCLQELKLPEPGTWVEYETTFNGEHAIVRYVHLPKGDIGDTARVELSVNKGKKAKEAQVYQILTPEFPIDLEQAQEIIFKTGDSKAAKVGPIMMRMVSKGLQNSGALKLNEVCNNASLVGNETITVSGGTFPTRHYTNTKNTSITEEQKYDTWVAGGVPFGLVKVTGYRYELALKGFGKDAQSSITETPEEAP